MKELERMMRERRRYRRKRGAWHQVGFELAGTGPDGRPPWCRGCAWWHVMAKGGCLVFLSCLECWLDEGECEAWTDEEGRMEIEEAIAEYACRHSRHD